MLALVKEYIINLWDQPDTADTEVAVACLQFLVYMLLNPRTVIGHPSVHLYTCITVHVVHSM